MLRHIRWMLDAKEKLAFAILSGHRGKTPEIRDREPLEQSHDTASY